MINKKVWSRIVVVPKRWSKDALYFIDIGAAPKKWQLKEYKNEMTMKNNQPSISKIIKSNDLILYTNPVLFMDSKAGENELS